MATRSKISQGGYTWWPKDWASDEEVFELTLMERGLYRELIDMAMLNDNKVKVNLRSFARKWNEMEPDIKTLMNRLVGFGLIEWDEKNDMLTIPSCEKRLVAIRSGRRGGKGVGKGVGKGMPKERGKQTETETETETETTDVDVRTATKTVDPSSLLTYKTIAQNMNNKKVLMAIINNKYKGEFDDFKDDEAKMNAFRHVMEDFHSHLISTNDTVKTMKDYAQHLHSWIRKQKTLSRFDVYPWQYYQHGANGKRAVNKNKDFIIRKDLKIKR